MNVYVLRLTVQYRQKEESGIIGTFSTWDLAMAYGHKHYRDLADGLVVWCIETFEMDPQ